MKCRQLEEEKVQIEEQAKTETENLRNTTKIEMDQLAFQCQKYKYELSQLNEFTEKKGEIEQQLNSAKNLLERKEFEFKETIHNLERKVLQDKNRMKREMLQKLNEV